MELRLSLAYLVVHGVHQYLPVLQLIAMILVLLIMEAGVAIYLHITRLFCSSVALDTHYQALLLYYAYLMAHGILQFLPVSLVAVILVYLLMDNALEKCSLIILLYLIAAILGTH